MQTITVLVTSAVHASLRTVMPIIAAERTLTYPALVSSLSRGSPRKDVLTHKRRAVTGVGMQRLNVSPFTALRICRLTSVMLVATVLMMPGAAAKTKSH